MAGHHRRSVTKPVWGQSYLLRKGSDDAALRRAGDRVVEHLPFKEARRQPFAEDRFVHRNMIRVATDG